ncbi:hypothetical protein [Bradyrhizobium sediminis]|nr:hypothetical protein [Bradyrhizobium sediminis]
MPRRNARPFKSPGRFARLVLIGFGFAGVVFGASFMDLTGNVAL